MSAGGAGRPWALSEPGTWCLFEPDETATDGRHVSRCGRWQRYQLDAFGREAPPEDEDVCGACEGGA